MTSLPVHKFIEGLSETIGKLNSSVTKEYFDFIGSGKGLLLSATHFDLTGIYPAYEPNGIDLTFKLPYKLCAIWFNNPEVEKVVEVLCCEETEESILLYRGIKTGNIYSFLPWKHVLNKASNDVTTTTIVPSGSIPDYIKSQTKEAQKRDFLALCSFLSLTQCNNISYDTVRPSQNLNKARLRKGKLPFFSYKILTIKRSNGTTIPLSQSSGERGSNRYHLVRGHIRRLRSGKNTWVTAHARGQIERGIISKDYKLTSEVIA